VGCEQRVTLAVALERGAGAVERVTVDLDAQAVVGPEEVDLETRDDAVDERAIEPVGVAEAQEELLEVGAGDGRARGVGAEDLGESARAAGRGMRSEHRLHGVAVEEAQDLGLVHRPLQPSRRKARGEIEDRPGGRRDRDGARPRGAAG